ncbi:MAG: hypothetical protein Q8M08_04860 [Bacteroidales bacterium]|nr:hypothetical protein [Bacteroidales bacterium]
MDLADRVKSFELLGERLRMYDENSTSIDNLPLVTAAGLASEANPWFTHRQIRVALNNLGKALTGANINRWLRAYNDKLAGISIPKTIGVVMAGNIPAVGFHDLLCVLIPGHKLVAKLSSSDNYLLPAMATILSDHMPDWQNHITFTSGRLENFDAIIATGSANTSRYFEFYFGKYPHIIRKNRNGIGALSGSETAEDLLNLADDILLFFGMGCRSISKIYVPRGYDFSPLIQALCNYDHFADHHKFRNNYDYLKSIFLVGREPFIDTGVLILKEDQAIASRIAMLHYEYYDHADAVVQSLQRDRELIQCVITKMELPINSFRPGEGQNPALWDYADQVDTMEFLLSGI